MKPGDKFSAGAMTVKILILDWDGTMFDSMAAKELAFAKTIGNFAGRPAQSSGRDIAAMYRKHSGHPRTVVIDRVCKDLGLAPSENQVAEIANNLGSAMSELTGECPLFPDTSQLIGALRHLPLKLYISSSVPEPELRYMVSRKLNASDLERFSGIFGTTADSAKGEGHVRRILSGGAQPERDQILAVGDDEADVELHLQAGVRCLLVDRERRDSRTDGVLHSLDELVNYLYE